MSLRDTLTSANADGTLLCTIAEKWYDHHKEILVPVIELHNSGQFDFVGTCGKNELEKVPGERFFGLQRVFCQVLPELECTVSEAAAGCQALYDKAAGDGTAGHVYESLRQWLEKTPQRVETSLVQIGGSYDTRGDVTRCVLLAGSSHDLGKYVKKAVKLSRKEGWSTRRGSIIAMGYLPLGENESDLDLVLTRLRELIEAPRSEEESGIAIEAAFNLLSTIGVTLVGCIEPLLKKACDNRSSISRQAIAYGLESNGKLYTDAMLGASLEALKGTSSKESETLQVIDSVLSKCDLENDRQRVLDVITGLLGRVIDEIDFNDLEDLQHKLKYGPGEILGWYAVSLLLTGNHRLCEFADRLLPFRSVPVGIDIDLATLVADSRWIVFLAKKLIGYCLINTERSRNAIIGLSSRCFNERRGRAGGSRVRILFS